MPPRTKTCPLCKTPLQPLAGSPGKWACSSCKGRFASRSKAEPPGTRSKPSGSLLSSRWLPLLLIPAVAFIGASIVLIVHYSRSASKHQPVAALVTDPSSALPPKDRSSATENAEVSSRLPRLEDADPPPPPPKKTEPEDIKVPSKERPPSLPAKETKPEDIKAPSKERPPSLTPSPINRAIDRGVKYLKPQLAEIVQSDKPRAPLTAVAALAGLALVESGVPLDDPVIRKTAERVRSGAHQLAGSYEVSVAIWFLDRLGKADDVALIRALALQLIAAQTVHGGWGYACRPLTDAEAERLVQLLKEDAPPATAPPAVRYRAGSWHPKDEEIRYSDNSNTQFAMLALWVARKHGSPVERSLAMVEWRFRRQQNREGFWGYAPDLQENDSQNRDSMTCAGLLGLAIGRALNEPVKGRGKDAEDPAIMKGLAILGRLAVQRGFPDSR